MPPQSIKDNPDVLVQVLELKTRNVHWRDVCRRLRISKNTYYRCLQSIDRRIKGDE